MNMIIWPLMTYTVTSFGKAFAHVRNCLLKKSTCLKKRIYKKLRCNSVKIRFSRKKILNYAYVLKNGVGLYNIFFFIFTQSLLNPPLCRLAWNEGNTSLFDSLASSKACNVYPHNIHLFMNMIIWPLMTYTVTSFGRAFAHVRNCLLKKRV
jgi:hypothetical protein